ncbi:hypothetical protein NO2_1469, partial [Candidatus Termititenax persephonae]
CSKAQTFNPTKPVFFKSMGLKLLMKLGFIQMVLYAEQPTPLIIILVLFMSTALLQNIPNINEQQIIFTCKRYVLSIYNVLSQKKPI